MATPEDAFVRRSLERDRLTLVCLMTRPGVHRFLVQLEYEHFPPGTPANADFEYAMMKWPDDAPLLWGVAIVPILKRPEVDRVAADAAMRVADGVPMVLFNGKVETHFPFHHRRVFTIENIAESPLYLPNGDAFLRAEERRWVDAFIKARGGRAKAG